MPGLAARIGKCRDLSAPVLLQGDSWLGNRTAAPSEGFRHVSAPWFGAASSGLELDTGHPVLMQEADVRVEWQSGLEMSGRSVRCFLLFSSSRRLVVSWCVAFHI